MNHHFQGILFGKNIVIDVEILFWIAYFQRFQFGFQVLQESGRVLDPDGELDARVQFNLTQNTINFLLNIFFLQFLNLSMSMWNFITFIINDWLCVPFIWWSHRNWRLDWHLHLFPADRWLLLRGSNWWKFKKSALILHTICIFFQF